jgi:hypothetical protein
MFLLLIFFLNFWMGQMPGGLGSTYSGPKAKCFELKKIDRLALTEGVEGSYMYYLILQNI